MECCHGCHGHPPAAKAAKGAKAQAFSGKPSGPSCSIHPTASRCSTVRQACCDRCALLLASISGPNGMAQKATYLHI